MTNDVETVEQVCEEFKTPKYTCKNCDFKICPSINMFSDRVLAAHKREVNELRRLLKVAEDTITTSRTKLRNCDVGTAEEQFRRFNMFCKVRR